jgi:alpha,alpha-trehalose-phosphate synthase [UDP-forming]/trehalose-phosphatase
VNLWSGEPSVRSPGVSTPLIVVSNREPYLHDYTETGGIRWTRTPGGVSVALDALMRERGGTWIAHGAGRADREVVDARDRIRVPPDGPRYSLRRIWLTEEEEQRYYRGFANEGLWPLCHVVHVRPIFRAEDWAAYQQVNARFAETIDEELTEATTPVFIHDYHLALVARELRKRRPNIRTALFWHIPWPHTDRLRICPWRKDILAGLLANDLLAFQVERDRRHFLQAVRDELGAKVRGGLVRHLGHRTRVTAAPIGVDYDRILNFATDERLEAEIGRLRRELRITTPLVGVGVDRLDYTKGIPERLDALDRLLTERPDLSSRLTFVQIGVPSRSKVAGYRHIERDIGRKIDEINSRHGTPDGHAPIRYHTSGLKLRRLVALFRMADFCIVSSLHDGMNLVAKEFVAARQDLDGVLVLSELAGASQELTDAVIINPYDVDGFAKALGQAIDMPAAERRTRMQAMQKIVAGSNVFAWASDILQDLEGQGPESYPGVRQLRAARPIHLAALGAGAFTTLMVLSARWRAARARRRRSEAGLPSAAGGADAEAAQVRATADEAIARAVAAVADERRGRHLLVLTDFDGTLCEFQPAPDAVWLDPVRRDLLTELARRPDVTVGLVSGRRLEDLERRAGLEAPVYYAGLHGLEIRGEGVSFVHDRLGETRGLLQVLARALEAHLEPLEGVHLENKDLSVAVHTRLASPEECTEAQRVVQRVVGAHVERATFRLLPGSSVTEILPNITWTKGDAVHFIEAEVERRHRQVWPVYLGDDVTDEDAFRAIGERGLTIIVGERPSAARLRLSGPPAVEAWLRGVLALPRC